jgi:hypothetical protein
MFDATKLYVVERCNALDDDSQPYTSYSWMTSENGISTDLSHAAIFTSEGEAQLAKNTLVIRDGYFHIKTLREALKNYTGYVWERSEMEHPKPKPQF